MTMASLARFEVAHFEDDRDATLRIGEELKPEAQAKPFSSMRASLALQASIAGPSADFSSNCATSKLTLRVTGLGRHTECAGYDSPIDVGRDTS